jgi:predicted ester cyclase
LPREEEEAPVSVEENNKALVRKFFEEVWSKGNVAAVDEFLAPDFVVHDTLSREEGGTEDYKRAVAEQIAASSDFHVSIEEQIAKGDKVVTRHVDSGTHDQEEFEGFAPSGARITMENITINPTRFSDNYFDLKPGEERTISVTNTRVSLRPEAVEVRWR